MLARLKMELKADQADFGYYQSSNMQGVLMGRLDGLYAEKLHESGLGVKSFRLHINHDEEKCAELLEQMELAREE